MLVRTYTIIGFILECLHLHIAQLIRLEMDSKLYRFHRDPQVSDVINKQDQL
jgi:hypothetical protein